MLLIYARDAFVSQKYVILYLPTLYESLAYKPPHNNDAFIIHMNCVT